MRIAVSSVGFQQKRLSMGSREGVGSLLDLISAVEINDLVMVEFLEAFRTGLGVAQAASPSSDWTLLKWVVVSLEQMFQGCSGPAEAVAREALHADTITLHFELMKSILRGRAGV